MTTLLHSKDAKYTVCSTGYTARIADRPIKVLDYKGDKWVHSKKN